jgi:hypothetical protein
MGATIYVNGKPTQLTLAQIPANQIASIEVISNPSARYDASTSGGIINLVLKKNREQGYNGLASVGVGNNSRYDATVNLDLQKGKWNITTLYSLNATKNPLNGYSHRITKDKSGAAESYFDQNTKTDQDNVFQSGRISADYSPNDKNVLTFAGTVVGGTDVVGATVVALGSPGTVVAPGNVVAPGTLVAPGADVVVTVVDVAPAVVVECVTDVGGEVDAVVDGSVVDTAAVDTGGPALPPSSPPLHAAITNTQEESNSPPDRLHIGPNVASRRARVASRRSAATQLSTCQDGKP